jgi:hypothetical protein
MHTGVSVVLDVDANGYIDLWGFIHISAVRTVRLYLLNPCRASSWSTTLMLTIVIVRVMDTTLLLCSEAL